MFYAQTKEGAEVVADLFGIVEGTLIGRDVAARLGITNVWDFSQHKIDPARIDVAGLRSLLATLEDRERYLYDLNRLERLRDLGFAFYFLPNG